MNKKTNTQQNQNEHGWDGDVHPEIAAIDHDANFEQMEQLMKIYSAYNHQHRKDGTAWKVWPDWELVLTSMNDALHFEDAERDTPEICAERQHWLNFMEYIHTSDAITSFHRRNTHLFAQRDGSILDPLHNGGSD